MMIEAPKRRRKGFTLASDCWIAPNGTRVPFGQVAEYLATKQRKRA